MFHNSIQVFYPRTLGNFTYLKLTVLNIITYLQKSYLVLKIFNLYVKSTELGLVSNLSKHPPTADTLNHKLDFTY